MPKSEKNKKGFSNEKLVDMSWLSQAFQQQEKKVQPEIGELVTSGMQEEKQSKQKEEVKSEEIQEEPVI